MYGIVFVQIMSLNGFNKHKVILDLGCGDGLNTAITFGAKIRDNYDRYEKAKSSYTGIYEKEEREKHSLVIFTKIKSQQN